MSGAEKDRGGAGREKKPSAPGAGPLAGLRSWPQEVSTFLGDVRAETKRVTWPTTKQIRATTVVVIITVFFFGAYFGVLDFVFNELVAWLLRMGS